MKRETAKWLPLKQLSEPNGSYLSMLGINGPDPFGRPLLLDFTM